MVCASGFDSAVVAHYSASFALRCAAGFLAGSAPAGFQPLATHLSTHSGRTYASSPASRVMWTSSCDSISIPYVRKGAEAPFFCLAHQGCDVCGIWCANAPRNADLVLDLTVLAIQRNFKHQARYWVSDKGAVISHIAASWAGRCASSQGDSATAERDVGCVAVADGQCVEVGNGSQQAVFVQYQIAGACQAG